MATTRWETKISKLTVAQGREYCSNEHEQWKYYKRNGVAERFNRTLDEKVRTVLIGSNLPKSMWSEAALMGTYLLNRSSTRLKAKSDFEKRRKFGCKAYAWVSNKQRKKLDNKSREGAMICFAPNVHHLWERMTIKVLIARDLKFNEECFPFRYDDQFK